MMQDDGQLLTPVNGSKNKGLSKRVVSNIGKSSGLQGVSVVLDLGIMALMSRLILPSEFGVLAAAMLLLAVCDLFREGGISAAIIQLEGLSNTVLRTAFTIAMLMSILFAALIQFGAGFYADFIRMPALDDVLRVMSLIFPIQAFSIISQSLLLRELRSPAVAMCEMAARAIAYFTVGAVMAWWGYGYWALVWASLAEAALRSGFMMALARPSIGITFNREAFKKLTSRSTGFASSKIITFVALRADDVIIGRYLDAASLGLYVRAYKLMSQPANLYTAVADRVVFPAFSKMQNDELKLKSAFIRGLGLTALVGMPLSILFFLVAPELISVLLGPNWLGVIPIFSVLAIAIYFRIAARVSASLLRATASIRSMILSQVFYAILTISLSLSLVRYGLVAVGIAIGLAVVAWYIVITTLACRAVKVSFREFLGTQAHGAVMLAGFGGGSYAVLYLLRTMALPAIVILPIFGIFVGACVGLLLLTRPRSLLGSQGVWIAEYICSVIPGVDRLMPKKKTSVKG